MANEVSQRRESLRRGSLLALERRSSQTIEIKEATEMTSKKLYGKDLQAYEDLDIDDLLQQLSPDEIEILSREVDPDDSLLPAAQRCSYVCKKEPTGALNRKQLIDHINKQAMEEPDRPEMVPFEAGKVRGKRWVPPTTPKSKQEEEVEIDLGHEYESALGTATEDDLVDLAAILGFHSMMNQDQYHASLLSKGQPLGLGWGGITKATKYKPLPNEPPNTTDAEEIITKVKDDDANTIDICWNNIKNISEEKFARLFDALKTNTRLESLSLCNCNLNDRMVLPLIDAIRVNHTLRILSVESNYITPNCLRDFINALLATKSIEEFRAANQKPEVLGNKIEMEITSLVENNPTILRLGLHFEYNDARDRVAKHLQKNRDKLRMKRLGAVGDA